MKAAVLTQLNTPLTVSETVQTSALQWGQVRVKVLVSGLCGAQLQEISGLKGNGKFLPHLMGHEGCGIVQEIGPAVSNVKVGDKVVMHWRTGKGIESPFPQYVYEGKTITSGKVVTLTEQSVVSENRLTVVPPNTDPVLCALLGCGMTTAFGVVNNDAKVKLGESVLVLGCGGVGLHLIRGFSMAGAFPVVGVDITDEKQLLARQNGATEYINSKNSGSMPPTKFDVIVDTTGNVEVIRKTMQMLSDKGRYILVSQTDPTQPLVIENPNTLYGGNGKTIIASQGGGTEPNGDIARYVKMYNSGLFDYRSITTHQYSLDEINTAVDVLRSGVAGRIMIGISQ